MSKPSEALHFFRPPVVDRRNPRFRWGRDGPSWPSRAISKGMSAVPVVDPAIRACATVEGRRIKMALQTARLTTVKTLSRRLLRSGCSLPPWHGNTGGQQQVFFEQLPGMFDEQHQRVEQPRCQDTEVPSRRNAARFRAYSLKSPKAKPPPDVSSTRCWRVAWNVHG